jgi:hypothetical protein
MNIQSIGQKKYNFLCAPTRKTLKLLIAHLKASHHEENHAEIALLENLLPLLEWELASKDVVNAETNTKEQHETEHRFHDISFYVDYEQPAFSPRHFHEISATAQLSFINGLHDIEWLEGVPVRTCIDQRILFVQALPSQRSLNVMLTGKFSTAPQMFISFPFALVKYDTCSSNIDPCGQFDQYAYICYPAGSEEKILSRLVFYELSFAVTPNDLFHSLTINF